MALSLLNMPVLLSLVIMDLSLTDTKEDVLERNLIVFCDNNESRYIVDPVDLFVYFYQQ